jgi:hypothetical protein
LPIEALGGFANFDEVRVGAYTRIMRNFFRRHPQIHITLHYIVWVVGGLALVQDKILGASALFPADSMIPRYIAYGLATVAFSNILLGQALVVTDPAAPDVPASEAVTKVEKVDPEKSA